MSDALSTTFELLTSTENKYAIDVLIFGLDVPNDTIKIQSALSLIKRRGARGTVEVVRRLKSLGPQVCTHFEAYKPRVAGALNQCLRHGDNELQKNALGIIRATNNYELFPTLLELLELKDSGFTECILLLFDEMINLVYENIHADPDSQGSRKHLQNAIRIQRDVLVALDKAYSDFESLNHPELLVHAVLALGDPGSFAVKKVMSQASSECRDLAARLLLTSKHPGVMQLPLDYMSHNYPHAKAFKIVGTRTDPEFICHLLRWFPKRLSENQQKNFEQIESIAWLNPFSMSLDMIPAGLQKSLIEFVNATGLPEDHKLSVQEWVVRNGRPEGRLAAADVLSSLNKSMVHDIIFDSLDSDESDVQAWTTSQVRSQGIPEAFSLLIDRLDSPMDAVRNAAREELESFNVERMLALFEHIDPTVCLRAGELIQKIDPDCIKKLQKELENPISRKRIRAAKGAQVMGLHFEAIATFIEMLKDDDAMIRRTAVEILATIPTDESASALRLVLDDSSARVREAARSALERMENEEIVAPVA
jgi:hypothetical protein